MNLIRMKYLFYICTFFLLFSCGPKAPTDMQVRDWYRELYDGWREAKNDAEKEQYFQKMTEKASQTFDIGEISAEQLKKCMAGSEYELTERIKVWLAPALAEQAKEKNIEGARAAYTAWKFFPVDRAGNISEKGKKAELKSFKTLLNHPVWNDFVKEKPEVLVEVYEKTYDYKGKELEESGVLEKLILLLDNELLQQVVNASMQLFETVFRDPELSPELKEQVREKILKQYITLLEKGQISSDRKKRELENTRNYLDGPYAKNRLIGYPAPALDFIWLSEGKETSLKDLKGKVVLLDFWGTKCAPCIGTFPEMRKLKEYYKGYPVEILGIVSLQGYHVDVKNNKTIRTDGKPELEMELMKTFMKDMGMTWRVAFTKQPVFNTDYGVGSIPHLVLIDPEGNVRYNKLDPFSSLEEKTDKINSLLKVAALPLPRTEIKS